jgi:hypothetical protein
MSRRTAAKARKYDYTNKRYVGDGHNMERDFVEVPVGDEMVLELRRLSKKWDSSHVANFLEERGTTLPALYEALDIKPEKLRGMMVREMITSDELSPLFVATTEDGFRTGINEVATKWEPLIGTTVTIDKSAAKWFNLEGANTSDDYTLKAVAQGSEIPVATLTLSEREIHLTKKGRGIQWTDEADIYMPVSLAQLYFRVLGIRIGQSYFRMVATRIMNGYLDDGSDAPTVINTLTAGTFVYQDVLRGIDTLQEENGFPATDMIMSPTRMIAMKVMETPAGDYLIPNGDIAAFFGLQAVHRSAAIPDDVIVIFNRSAALTRYVAKPFSTEEARYESRQINAIYGTLIDQVVPAIPNSRVVVDSTWV